MVKSCAYCHGALGSESSKCANCGAPVTAPTTAPDYRSCPYCRRRLLALGSPACNYCGRRLPQDYIAAREADLRRIIEAPEGEPADETLRYVEETLNRAATPRQKFSWRSLFGALISRR